MWFKKEKQSGAVFVDSVQAQQYRAQEEDERKRLEQIRACESCPEIFQSYYRPLTYHSYDKVAYEHHVNYHSIVGRAPHEYSVLERYVCPKCNEIRDRKESVTTWARMNYEKVEEFRRQEEKVYGEPTRSTD